MNTSFKLMAGLSLISIAALSSNVAVAGPEEGATCRSGFVGKLNGGKFTCEKTVVKLSEFKCSDESPLRNYVVRVNNQRDLCAANDLNIPSSGSLEGYDQAGARIAGQPTLVKIPAGVQLTGVLSSRAGAKDIPGGARSIPVSDADFIFVGANDGMNKAKAAGMAAAHELIHRKSGATFPIDAKVVSYRVVNDAAAGSRDALEATITEFSAPVLNLN
jgi:hypothetical protein